MEWAGEGIVLGARKHGETSAIAEMFTREHGRHAGLVRGGISRKMRPILQPGNTLQLEWRARMEDQLGFYTIEPAHLRVNAILDDRLALSGLTAACAVARDSLPDREPAPALYDVFDILLDNLGNPDIWPALYVRWELGVLQTLGYGLDLSKCAATGATEDLTHVSPRTGRAVSREAAEPYLDKLFPLPRFLLGEPVVDPEVVGDGLALTGHFMETRVFWNVNKPLPEPRQRMVRLLAEEGYAQLRAKPEVVED